MDSETPIADDIQAELERILANPRFASAPQLSSFLRFVVEETLAGREARIKQYTIAVKAFGRGRDFSPATDPIVRIQASRLRRFLERYYREQGAGDPIRIEIPVGTYVPIFRPNEPVAGDDVTKAIPLPLTNKDAAAVAALPSDPSILVVPLEVLADDPEQVYFADGLTEELAVALTGYPGIVILGPLSRERLKSAAVAVDELAQRYGARFVLQGKFRRRGNQVRTSFKLIDVDARGVTWAKTFDSHLSATALFEFEDTVASEVAATLADNFGVIPRAMARKTMGKRTDSLEAYDAVLRCHHYFSVLTGEAWRSAYEALERAVTLDPNYALTRAMLADMCGAQYHLLGAGEQTLTRMEDLVRHALQLDPHCQSAHQMRAMVHFFRGRRDLFIGEAEWAVQLNPKNSSAIASVGLFLAIVGEWERGLALLEQAMRLNPHYPGWYHLGPFLNSYRAGAYEGALGHAMRISTSGFFFDPLARAATLGQLGRQEEARVALEELRRELPDTDIGLRALMRRTLFSDENVDMLLNGLRKAGLVLE